MPHIPCAHTLIGSHMLSINSSNYFPLTLATGSIHFHPRCNSGGTHMWRHSGGDRGLEKETWSTSEERPVRKDRPRVPVLCESRDSTPTLTLQFLLSFYVPCVPLRCWSKSVLIPKMPRSQWLANIQRRIAPKTSYLVSSLSFTPSVNGVVSM